MFPGGFFPSTFFPPGWWPKTGASKPGGGFKGAGDKEGSHRHILRLLAAEAEWRRRRRQEQAARSIETLLTMKEEKRLEWMAEQWHANRMSSASAYSVLLAEL